MTENRSRDNALLTGLFKGGIYRLMYMAMLFLIGLIFAALSGAATFGTISLMIANAAIFQIITGLGTDSSIIWHGSGGGFKKEKLFSFAFLSGLFQIILFAIVSFIVVRITGKLLLSWQPGMDQFGTELLYFSSIVIIEKYASLLYAQQRAADCNKVLAFSVLLILLFLGLLNSGTIQVRIDMVQLYCWVSFVPALSIAVYYHLKPGKLFAGFTANDLRSFFHFSLIVFITNFIQFIAYRADFWLIDFFRDTEQVGVYAQANRFAQLLWVIPNILAGMLAPVIATGSFDKARLVMMARLLCYFNLFLLLVIAVVSWFFYNYFLDQEFFAGYKTLFLMMPGYYFFCLNILFAAWFSAKRLLWINFAGSLLCLILVLLVDWILIPRMGINGAAWANTIAYSVAGFFHVWMFMRITQTSFSEFFRFNKEDWRRIIKLQP